MFETYAKTYGTENFTMRNWADFQNYKDKTLDSVIAVTTAKFSLFNIQSVIDLTKRDTLDLKTWGTQKTMVYLLWSSFFVTLLAKKYHYSIMQLPLLHAG